MKNITIKVNVELDNKILLNVITSAVEQGSTYWLDTSSPKMLDVLSRADGDTLAETMFNALMDDIDIPLQNINGDKFHMKLSSRGLNYRLQLLYNSEAHRWAIVNEMKDEGDLTSSDIVFQYMCFGEIIYS